MLFKLQSFVFSAVCLVAISLSLGAQEIPPHSYRGKILGLANAPVREMAIRKDGRYLFYAAGSAWNVVDLQDMVTTSNEAVPVSGNIIGLDYEDPNRLIVMTTKGVEYFDVEKVFSSKAETTSYVRPDESTRPLDACRVSSGRIFMLEGDTEDRHIVRVIGTEKTEILPKVEWRFIFDGIEPTPDEILPLGLRCAKEGVLILGLRFVEENGEGEDPDPDQIFLGYLPAGNPSSPASRIQVSSNLLDYEWKDMIVDPRGEKALFLFNHLEPDEEVDDAKAIEISIPNLGNRREMNLGSGGQALASFWRASQSIYSFFVKKDIWGETAGGIPEFQVLQLAASAFGSSNPNFGDRGTGTDKMGRRDLEVLGDLALSKWLSTPNDSYVYGIVEPTGVSLLSNAPLLELAEAAENLELSHGNALRFKIRSDEDVNLEIRFSEDVDLEGESTGLSNAWGRQIIPAQLGSRGLELEANQIKEIVITQNDLKIKKNGAQSLVIFAQRKQSPANFPVARLGIPFSFDPPPPAVSNFHLGYGDRSVHVFFEIESNPGDLSTYLIYASENLSDLASLPADKSELESVWKNRSLSGHAGKQIKMPIQVQAKSWDGSYVIAPLENGKKIYVRVQVQDTKGNFSAANPAAKAETPRATKSLVSAFGNNSCALGLSSENQTSFWFILAGTLFLLFWIRRRSAG